VDPTRADRTDEYIGSDPLSAISGEVAAAVRRKWGRGPISTTARWAGPNMLLVLLEDGHSDHERSLRAAGRTVELADGRRVLQELLEDELRSTVETISGREVIAVLGATRLDPDLSAEIFVLAPASPAAAPAGSRVAAVNVSRPAAR
jgi:uncharacterized protein YbcI